MVFPFQDELLKEATVNERKAGCFDCWRVNITPARKECNRWFLSCIDLIFVKLLPENR